MFYIFLCFIILLPGSACKKNREYNLQTNLNIANDLVLIDRSQVYGFQLVVKAMNDTNLMKNHSAVIDSVTIVYDPSNNQFSFFFASVWCSDSVFRTGSFDVTVTGDFFSEGSEIRYSYHELKENSHGVNGSRLVTHTGPVTGAISFSNSFRDGLITKDSLRNILFESDQQYLLYGNPTYGKLENPELSVSGSITGTCSDGYPFSSQTIQNLNYSFSCPWINQGIIDFVTSEVDVLHGTIRYGVENTCSDRILYDFAGNYYDWYIREPYLRD